jgi:predicted CXXCH cytochrome family protein
LVASRSKRNRAGLVLAILIAIAGTGCGSATGPKPGHAERLEQPSRWGTPSVFTPAHRTAGDAIRSFFGASREVQQPVAFSHQLHLAKQMQCIDCHEGVERGPVAGLPGLNTCMICHSQIATDRPVIQELTTQYEKGLDVTWPRVYGYAREAHVRFEHAPHVRAGVPCASCHGDLTTETVARRVVEMDMGFCVSCHKEKQASNDCLTCHY